MPQYLKEYLSNYDTVLIDAFCKEPIAWGYRIIKHLGEEKWKELYKYGTPTCLGYSETYPLSQHANWILITKELTKQDAIDKYGKVKEQGYTNGCEPGVITNIKPFPYIVFGNTKFYNTKVQIPTPEEQKIIDEKRKEEVRKANLKYEQERGQEPTYDICFKCQKKKIEEDKYWYDKFDGVEAGRKCGSYQKGASAYCPLYAYDREIIKKEKNKRDSENRRKRKEEGK